MKKSVIIELNRILKKYKWKYIENINWNYLSIYQKLSDEFIKEFQNKLNWYNISWHQKLSEKFIKEFKNKVDWNEIAICQILSKKFIKEFKDKLSLKLMLKYKKITQEFYDELTYIKLKSRYELLDFA